MAAFLGAWQELGPRAENKNICVGRAPFAQPTMRGKILTHNRADHGAEKKKNLYLPCHSAEEKKNRPSPPKKKIITVPSRRGGKCFPFRPAEKKKYRPVPPRGKIFTVPSRRGKKYLSSRPAEGKNIYRPVPSRGEYLPRSFLPSCLAEKSCTRCPVPPTFYVFFLSSRPVTLVFSFPPNNLNLSRPPTVLNPGCDKPRQKRFYPCFVFRKKYRFAVRFSFFFTP